MKSILLPPPANRQAKPDATVILKAIWLSLTFLSFLIVAAPTLAADSSWEKAVDLDQNGFFEEAIEEWEKLLASSTIDGLKNLAALKLSGTYLKIHEFEKSAEIAKALIAKNKEDFDAYFHLANAYGRVKNYPDAIKAFENTVRIRPEEGLGLVGLAVAQFAAGDAKAALGTLQTAKTLFKSKRNIQWYQDTRIMAQQIKGFAKYPASFANLWIENNFKLVRETYENKIFDYENRAKALTSE